MSWLGWILLEWAIRVSAFASVGALLYVGLRRRGPEHGLLCLTIALMLVGCVSLATLVPQARWLNLTGKRISWIDVAKGIDNRLTRTDSETRSAVESEAIVRITNDGPATRDLALIDVQEVYWRTLLSAESLMGSSDRPTVPATRGSPVPEPGIDWASLGLLSLVVGLGAVRLSWAIHETEGLRSRSIALRDPEVEGVVESLRGRLGLKRPVEVRISSEVETPSTLGWRRAVILLPVGWRDYGPQELRAVIAHELAHVARNDYFNGLLAQVCLTVHLFHPAVHRLVAWLRWEQERVADERASGLLEDPKRYLQSLARLALIQPTRPVRPGLVRPLLHHASKNTNVRRIRMLQDQLDRQRPPLGWMTRLAIPTLFMFLAAVVAGARLFDPAVTAEASEASSTAEPLLTVPATGGIVQDDPDANRDLIRMLPEETIVAVWISIEKLRSNPSYQELLSEILPGFNVNVDLDAVSSVLLAQLSDQPPVGYVLIWKGSEPLDPRDYVPSYDEDAVRSIKVAGRVVKILGSKDDRTDYESNEVGVYQPDPSTIVSMQMSFLERLLRREGRSSPPKFESAMIQSMKGDAAIVVTERGLETLTQAIRGSRQLALFSPLTMLPEYGVVSASVVDSFRLRIEAEFDDEDDAARWIENARAGLVLVRNLMDQARQEMRDPNSNQAQFRDLLDDVVDPLIDSVQFETQGERVFGTAGVDDDRSLIVGTVANAFVSARVAASRAVDQNNLKQIGLALHNYYAAYDHLPPAVLTSENGTPYSWRVEILPFIEQGFLYDRYDTNLPWNHPTNLKVLKSMPRMYRSPLDSDASTNTGYAAVVGPDTAIASEGTGNPFRVVTDGLSNTLMVLGVDTEIPWTKPEDIPFTPEISPSTLKSRFPEGFSALMGDGSVKFLSETIDAKIFRALLTKSGGEVISMPMAPNP